MISLYVHIPFCERKCPYCDFYSVEGTELVEEFLASLSREIGLRRADTDRIACETIFFGGGTPSLLTPRQLEGILWRLHTAFRIAPEAEVTLEANPGTVTEEKLRAFRSLGVNRLSLGVQSFHDSELRSLGRIHDGTEALRSIELARTAGYENVGIDLIYSIPEQTLAAWEDNLRTAAHLAPQHVAAYSLIVEDDTPFARMAKAGEIRATSTDLEARMYERTMEILSAHAYDHYEVSNYALDGFRCRHNSAYWSHQDYLGFGPSAHSFWKGEKTRTARRWWNVSGLSTYIGLLAQGHLPLESEEQIGTRELIQERILLGLRSSGLDLMRLNADLGYDLQIRQGEMVRWTIEAMLAVQGGGMLRLTPKGYMLCDEIYNRLIRNMALERVTDRLVPSPSG